MVESGYSRAVSMEFKAELISTLKYHYTLYCNKAAMDQLKAGLNVVGVSEAMTQYPHLLESYFVSGADSSQSWLVPRNLQFCVGIAVQSIMSVFYLLILKAVNPLPGAIKSLLLPNFLRLA